MGEYFHNYPHLGLDILYDSLHRAAKVILKTNALGYGSLFRCMPSMSLSLCSLLIPSIKFLSNR